MRFGVRLEVGEKSPASYLRMTNWKNHLGIGVILSLIFIVIMNLKFGWYDIKQLDILLPLIAITLISPLVLDLDHEMGKLHQTFLLIGTILSLVGLYFLFFNSTIAYKPILTAGVLLFSLTFTMGYLSSHRGFIHSISFCALYSLMIIALTKTNIQLGILGFIGSYSHLVADGIPGKVI